MLFFFKQQTAYELRISDWSSDVCSSDLPKNRLTVHDRTGLRFLDEPARVGRELPLDPASLPSFLLHFLPRGLDQTEPLGRPLAAPGLVILGKQGAMESLEHIDNSLIALEARKSVGTVKSGPERVEIG